MGSRHGRSQCALGFRQPSFGMLLAGWLGSFRAWDAGHGPGFGLPADWAPARCCWLFAGRAHRPGTVLKDGDTGLRAGLRDRNQQHALSDARSHLPEAAGTFIGVGDWPRPFSRAMGQIAGGAAWLDLGRFPLSPSRGPFCPSPWCFSLERPPDGHRALLGGSPG